jgi:hypothetical protein
MSKKCRCPYINVPAAKSGDTSRHWPFGTAGAPAEAGRGSLGPGAFRPEAAMKFEALTPVARRGRAVLALEALAIASLVQLCVARSMLFAPGGWLPLAALAASCTFVGAAFALGRKKARWVVADESGFSIDGARFLERAAVVSAYRATAEGGLHTVHVEGRLLGQSCTVYLDSEEQGRELLAALRFGAVHFRALPPWAKHLRWLTLALTMWPLVFMAPLRNLPAWGIAALAALYGVILLPVLLPQRVDIGHDGVSLRWLGRERFIPFADIESALGTAFGVDLVLRDGRRVEIRLTHRKHSKVVQMKAILARIREGDVAQLSLARADEEALLARGGRDLEAWMRAMRALGASASGGYRAAAIPRERLWAIVESPVADPSAREGAAIALSALLDEADRARLATLAQDTAQPRLRVALDGVSRGHEGARLRVALEAAESGRNAALEAARGEPDEPASGGASAARTATARGD